MRLTALAFILAQFLDLLTTAAGIALGAVELNPFAGVGWGRIAIAKAAVILGGVVVLQFKRRHWLDWVVPLTAGAVVPWNLLNILVR